MLRLRRCLLSAACPARLQLRADPFEEGHPLISLITENIPEEIGAQPAKPLGASLNLNALLPTTKDYVAYTGSLTTPGCGEGVAWHVMTRARPSLSVAQLNEFQKALASAVEPLPVQCPLDDAEPEGPTEPATCKHALGARTNNRGLQRIEERTLFISKAPRA